MRTVTICLAAFMWLAPSATAGGIDGRWSAEVQSQGKKATKKSNTTALQLTSDGKQLSGSVGQGKRAATIQDGKIDGNTFSFATVRKSKKGEAKILWNGTLEGEEIKGTTGREGGKRRATFVAKRM